MHRVAGLTDKVEPELDARSCDCFAHLQVAAMIDSSRLPAIAVSGRPAAPVALAGPDRWYALYVKPRHEKKVSLHLESRGFEQLVPFYLKRTPQRVSELPLFPGY